MPKIDQLLRIVKDAQATDLHLAAGAVPMIRVHSRLEKTSHKRLSGEAVRQLLYEILTDSQIKQFESCGDVDLAYSIEGLARFRVNIYRTISGPGAAVRVIPDRIMTLSDLGFSEAAAQLVERQSGLVLVTGPTNSGKSTTLAAMVDHINSRFSKHVITLEDPIEYVHETQNSLVSQRQIGLHSASFTTGLRAALREDPDVILVGEMRDTETISLAITAAETGLLVLGTLHTCTAAGTVDRIIDVFPADHQQQVRVMLAETLQGVVSQQLLSRADGRGRIVAYEFMLATPPIRTLIREGRAHQIPSVIQTSRKQGMRLLDNHLKALVDTGQVAAHEAMRVATDPAAFLQQVTNEDRQPVEV
jgi:twitching motility protein PilT